MNKDQIKHMVNRFLGWSLPESFSPDAGISFTPATGQCQPSGTNLFDATQADAMVRYMVEGMPASAALPEVDLSEQKHLLIAAAAEIQSLRRVNEVLAAKVETMDLLGTMFRTRPDYGSQGMAEDIVWRMQRQVAEIDGAQLMRAS